MKRPDVDLSGGITLEISSITIPWKTSFNDLPAIGSPEIRKQKEREVLVWKNERVLNGIKVDLSAVYEKGVCRRGQLMSVSAYLCESSFQSAREILETQFKTPPRFKKLNDIEYTFTWKAGNCDVVLSHLDRFGSYFRLDIKLRPECAALTALKNLLSKLNKKQPINTNGYNFNFAMQSRVLTQYPVYI